MNYNELKAARVRRGITSKSMAEKLGISPAQYSYKENGYRNLLLRDVKKIADVLHLTTAEIMFIFFDVSINSNDNKIV